MTQTADQSQPVEVASIQDLINAVLALHADGQELWFRGQSNAKWIPEPGVTRPANFNYPEQSFIDQFRRQASASAAPLALDDWGWVTFAQHHHVPTRLLDWSTNPLTALYFAVEKEDLDEEVTHSSLFILRPWGLNGFRKGGQVTAGPELLNDSNAELSCMRPGENPNDRQTKLPIAVLSPTFYDRIRFQSGTFTLHYKFNEFDTGRDWTLGHTFIQKLVIPRSERGNLRNHLAALGVNKYSIYRNNDDLAAQVVLDVKRSANAN